MAIVPGFGSRLHPGAVLESFCSASRKLRPDCIATQFPARERSRELRFPVTDKNSLFHLSREFDKNPRADKVFLPARRPQITKIGEIPCIFADDQGI